MRARVLLSTVLLTLIGIAAMPDTSPAQQRQVLINRTRIPADTLRLLEQQFQTRIPDGRYWYDRQSGAWGMEGGHTLGFTLPNLPLGGPMPADISGGRTGVFINGRELPLQDLLGLQALVQSQVAPGRYWVDAQGYAGQEGGPALVNLKYLASQGLYRQGSGVGENMGSASAYSNPMTGIGVLTDGQGGAAVFNH